MSLIEFYFFVYLFIINVLTFDIYAVDKRRAVYGKWRIPELLLLLLAVIGGAYGAGAAMLLFRHKTKHLSFQITVPLCLVIWLAVLVFLCIQ